LRHTHGCRLDHPCDLAGSENAVTLNYRDGTCSGTKVGPHTILTATHCFASGQALVGIDDQPVTQTGTRMDDGSDHTLATVSATFPTWARFGASPVAGDAVHIWGSPGGLHHMLRVGTVSGWQEGRCVTFDDTFEHEAWNSSDQTRVVMLLDVWNPHLSNVEREAVTCLVESIGDFNRECEIEKD